MTTKEAETLADNCTQLRRVCDIISRDLEACWGCLKYAISEGVDEGTARILREADSGELSTKLDALCGHLHKAMVVASGAKHWSLDLHSQEARDYFESLAEAAENAVA